MTPRTLHAPRAQFALDLARTAFFGVFRQALPADEPEVLRLLAAIGWHFEATLSPGRTAWMVEELVASFALNPRAADAAAREAWDLWMQTRLEDVVLSRVVRGGAPGTWVRVEGEVPERGLLLHLSAGNRRMAAWALAEAGVARGREPGWLGVYGLRGLPPVGRGSARRSWLNERESRARLADEDTLPMRWLGDEEALRRHVEGGGLAIVAADDRGFREMRHGVLLGRPTPLASLPWALATTHPVALLSVERLRDKTHLARISAVARRRATGGGPGAVDREATLGLLEDDLRRRPGHYAMTLVERRLRQ